MARPLLRLAEAIRHRPVESVIVHRAAAGDPPPRVVAPGVRAASVEEFLGAPAWR